MNKKLNLLGFLILILSFHSCKQEKTTYLQDQYAQILDITYTPNAETRSTGWFTDQGAWMGFTIPKENNWINGFCGPFSLDHRTWIASAAVHVTYKNKDIKLVHASTNYLPGEIHLVAKSDEGTLTQQLFFVDNQTALLHITSTSNEPLLLSALNWDTGVILGKEQNKVIATHPNGEIVTLTFPESMEIKHNEKNYEVISTSKDFYVEINHFFKEMENGTSVIEYPSLLANAKKLEQESKQRWNNYLSAVLRNDMPDKYNRIAVKSVVTLIANWQSSKGGLLHDGIVPSHAVGYFMGFWAWDTWKTAVAMAKFTPELAKDQIRSMFDYQLIDGMIIDCIYSNPEENNQRDSKPPLAAWAVYEVYKQTNDLAFLKEMYYPLVSYHKWWYDKRDHNQNGICEFGSTDGTLVAAAWESGMDNAIRFDEAEMVQNSTDAWSVNQESVDLNAYLAYEYKLLEKIAKIIDQPLELSVINTDVADYFFDEENGFFFDRRLKDGSFIVEFGCEGYTPFWTGIASQEQMDKAIVHFQDPHQFSTYIPFPTAAANNPKFMPNGYWRGPIWLDQTYFAIKGLRNYGYNELADNYTEQVFERLDGLTESAPIHENYDTHTGGRLKAPHFSWSSAHLLMLYNEYKK